MATLHEQSNPWKTLNKKEVYDNPWIKVEEHQVLNPSGNKGIYGKVHFKNRAIGIIPLDEQGNTWLVGQHRYVVDAWSWEIPEGGGSIHEDVLEAAKRELQEETGLTAIYWTALATVYLSNSVSDEAGYIFLAEGLTEGKAFREETEADMQIKKIPLQNAVAMVLQGQITDSLSMIGLLKLARIKGL